jgi:protein kinase D
MAEIGFLFQFGTIREIVTTNSSTLTLSKLKDMACEFINTKVSE